MKIKLPIKALSVNDAYTGRRFQTPELKQYKRDCSWMLNRQEKLECEGEYELIYTFYLKNYGQTDLGNLEKPITDILVEVGIVPDDRRVKKITMLKERGKDSIEIEIKPTYK